MAKSPKQARVLATLTAPIKVEFREPLFEPLSSLSALDFKRLGKGNHKIEIGFVKGGCCRNLVRAVVKNGLVIGCEVEPCEETSVKTPKELLALLAKARKKIRSARRYTPMPLKQLVSSPANMQGLIIWGGGCVFICCVGHCIMCCWYPWPHCYFPDIYTGPL